MAAGESDERAPADGDVTLSAPVRAAALCPPDALTAPAASPTGGSGPVPGDRWARYQVLEALGEGGTGAVYAAHDDELDRGVAIAPGGAALVYSSCGRHADLLEVTASPPRRLLDSEAVVAAAFGPGGLRVWTERDRGIDLLHVQHPDGRDMQLTPPALGSVTSAVVSTSGGRLAFAIESGDAPGLYVVDVAPGGSTHQLTSDAGDTGPVWTADDKIAFTRSGGDGVPHAYLLDPDSGIATRPGSGSHTVVGAHPGTGEVLLRQPVAGRHVAGLPDRPDREPGLAHVGHLLGGSAARPRRSGPAAQSRDRRRRSRRGGALVGRSAPGAERRGLAVLVA